MVAVPSPLAAILQGAHASMTPALRHSQTCCRAMTHSSGHLTWLHRASAIPMLKQKRAVPRRQRLTSRQCCVRAT